MEDLSSDKGPMVERRSRLFFENASKYMEEEYDKEKTRGKIILPKGRWDDKDQKEFEDIPIETLILDQYYLGLGKRPCALCNGSGKNEIEEECPECKGTGEIPPVIFKSHLQDLLQLWEARKKSNCDKAVFQEGIGSGKTTKFSASIWLQVTEVITKVDPFSYYGLNPKGQGIVFICMSRNEKLAKKVTFMSVLPMFNCPFYNEHFPPHLDITSYSSDVALKNLPSELRFPKRIIIFPGTGSALSAIGYNIFGGGIDEVNYLEIVDSSKKAVNNQKYDAAESMFTSIMARMTSRFEPERLYRQGKMPGLLVMFSNPKHSGDFTSRMGIQSKSDKTIFFRRRCTWEAHPKERFSGETFLFDVYNRKIIYKDDPRYEEFLATVKKRMDDSL